MMSTNCSVASQLSQFSDHSQSADFPDYIRKIATCSCSGGSQGHAPIHASMIGHDLLTLASSHKLNCNRIAIFRKLPDVLSGQDHLPVPDRQFQQAGGCGIIQACFLDCRYT